MAIKLIKASNKCRVENMPKTASTAISEGQALYTTSGAVSPLSAASDERIAGISLRTVISTDSDYATSGATIPVLIDEDGVWEADPSSTTNTITYGTYLDFNNSTTVHVSNSTYDQFLVKSSGTNLSKIAGIITRWEGSEPPATN